MAARLVRGACPHDCPDTCAMHVTVEDGRATAVSGDPDHPITVGFLCGKVSNYLDRVYSEERLLHPLVRDGDALRRASWDEALDRVAAGLSEAREGFGGESILPYSYMGTQGLIQGNTMSARVMNALGASALERTICATAGIVGTVMAHGLSPEVDPEEWPNARYVLLWGWNPLSTAPHLWRKLLDARKQGARIVVVDPFRSRTARVADEHLTPLPGSDAALATGMMRAVVDAGLQDEAWCRDHADGYEELLTALQDHSVERCAELCGVPAADIERIGREFASQRPSLLRLGVGAQRHMGAPAAYSTIASLPALTGAWRDRGGGCSYIPTATASAISSQPLERDDLRPGPVRTINMSQLGQALTDPRLDPPVKALVCWNSNPGSIAPDQERVVEGLRRDDLFVVVLEQFMTDTAAHADVVLPATTQLEHLDVVFSWGHHYVTWNEPAIEPVGEAKPNTEAFRLIAQRLGFDDPCFADTDRQLVDALLDGFSENGLRERGWTKVDLGQGPVPHAHGGFGTESGRVMLRAEYVPPVEVADGALAQRFPLAMITPKTHLFLNSTFANQKRQHSAQPSPEVVLHPDDARPRGIEDGARVRVFNDRGDFTCPARVSDDARRGVLVAPMGWWNADYKGGRSGQATTSQALTALGNAPTFNDNRVEVERVTLGGRAIFRPMAETVVMKFGGTSVADAERIKRAAGRIVQSADQGNHVVAVLSARGKHTDELVSLAHEVSDRPHPREMDMLLSTGERVSCALAAMVINDRGHEAISLTGSQAGIVTDSGHTRARILEVRAHRIREALERGKIVLVAGFQGVSQQSLDVTTLGRGGSDTTAVALAAALGAEVCEIYTDVPGVFSADPRIVPAAKKLPVLTFEEMLEMSASGAGVLQLRSVEYARNHGVTIHCRSSFEDGPGTVVGDEDLTMERPLVTAVTHSTSEARITLTGVPDRPGIAGRVLTALADANVNVDMIIQNEPASEGRSADMSVTVPRDDLALAREALEPLAAELGFGSIQADDQMGKVSLVGAGMRSHPGVAAKALTVLGEADVNIEMISTSPIKISCVVREQDVRTAVKQLHTAFGLGAEAVLPEDVAGDHRPRINPDDAANAA